MWSRGVHRCEQLYSRLFATTPDDYTHVSRQLESLSYWKGLHTEIRLICSIQRRAIPHQMGAST